MYLPASQADSVGFQYGLVDIQLNSGDLLKKRSPTPLPSFLLLVESGRFSVNRVSATLLHSPVVFIDIQNGLVALLLNSWDQTNFRSPAPLPSWNPSSKTSFLLYNEMSAYS